MHVKLKHPRVLPLFAEEGTVGWHRTWGDPNVISS